jgi:hypothetical protein
MKRPRINSNRVNVSKVVEHLERKRKVYSEAINDLMDQEGVPYNKAKELLNRRLVEKVIFKF